MAHSLSDATLEITPSAQRGFCRNRQPGLNVVDVDAYTRVFQQLHSDQVFTGEWTAATASQHRKYRKCSCVLCNIDQLPCTPLYDFCNAFPTLIHAWMFMVLRCLRLPKSFMNAIRSMYKNISAGSPGIGTESFLFILLGGAKTGCPLSSAFFLLSIHPLCSPYGLVNLKSESDAFDQTF